MHIRGDARPFLFYGLLFFEFQTAIRVRAGVHVQRRRPGALLPLLCEPHAALGCGAYLGSLCRTRIGEFLVNEALTIENFEKEIKAAVQ